MAKKKNNEFKIPYIGYDNLERFDVIAHNENHLSITFKCVFSFSNTTTPTQYQETIFSILKSLEGYYFQKHDVFFEDSILTYITIIKPSNGSFFTHSNKKYNDFISVGTNLLDLLGDNGFNPEVVRWEEFNALIKSFLAFKFTPGKIKLSSIAKNDFELIFGKNNFVQSKSFTHNSEPGNSYENGFPFPADLLNFIYEIENHNGKVYHQVIYVPDQKKEFKKMEGELRRAVAKYGEEEIETIERLKRRISEEKEILIYGHFDVFYSADSLDVLNDISSFIDDKVAPFGVTPSKNNFNQFEIYYASFPGNAIALHEDDLFKTLSKPLTSFILKAYPMEA